mmetsp:Transcript_17836/g.26012  ORF Transcript_17836/g.26012 Transcript_17836/m.26012 type:complete len:233 (-) Transcript_17836:213-911(-)
MLSIMTADWRLVAVTRERSPLRRRGTTIARAGDCTDWTKVTPARVCMISGTSFGWVIERRICVVMCSISLLPMTSHAAVIARDAASETCFLVSVMQGVTAGTTSGRAALSCSGQLSPKAAITSSAATRVCHACSTAHASKQCTRTPRTQLDPMLEVIACTASLAASRTTFCFEPAAMKRVNKLAHRKGSAEGMQLLARVLKTPMAAAAVLASALPVLDAFSTREDMRPGRTL